MTNQAARQRARDVADTHRAEHGDQLADAIADALRSDELWAWTTQAARDARAYELERHDELEANRSPEDDIRGNLGAAHIVLERARDEREQLLIDEVLEGER